MKIIQITASYKPAFIYGGPIQSVSKLCEAINQFSKRHQPSQLLDLEVLTTTANGKSELQVTPGKPTEVNGVTVTYFKRQTKDHSHLSLNLLWHLRKTILLNRKEGILIHIHAWWNLVSILSCLMAKWYHVPVILSPRGMLSNYSQHHRHTLSKKIFHHLIGKRLLRYCSIHATSNQEKAEVSEIVPTEHIKFIPNLIHLSKQRQPIISRNQDGIFKLIFLSRVQEKKGLELLLKALAGFDNSWRLSIAGTGDPDYIHTLKIQTEQLKISNRVVWHGQISDQDKYPLMAAHDLLVLTSYNENFANVVPESLSVGTPVLVSDQVGLADYVLQKQLGWICTLSVDNIIQQLSQAFANQALRQHIRQHAAGIIQADFNDDALASTYLDFYRTEFEKVKCPG